MEESVFLNDQSETDVSDDKGKCNLVANK